MVVSSKLGFASIQIGNYRLAPGETTDGITDDDILNNVDYVRRLRDNGEIQIIDGEGIIDEKSKK